MTRTDPRPTTEAGRDALHAVDMFGEAYNVDVGYKQWQKRILAIEEQARAEGRQEAVRNMLVNARENDWTDDELWPLFKGMESEAAGLNASESPPPDEDEVERLIRLTEDIFGSGPRVITDWRKFYSVLVGDASESPPPMKRVASGLWLSGDAVEVGDASESGQPTEASDE